MREVRFDESAICPLANVCEATVEDAAPCGTSGDHLSPLVLAEDLCQRAVAGRMYHERQPFDDRERELLGIEAERDLRLAWLRLERAMPKYVERAGALDCFDDAKVYADRVIHNTQTRFNVWQSAVLLKGFLPLFRSRRFGLEFGEDLDSRFLQFARQSTAKLGRTAREAPIHIQSTHPDHLTWANHPPCFDREAARNGFLKKIGGMLLALRAGLKIYPASVRESAVISHRVKTPATGYSHDYYALTPSSQKIPVKTKAGSDNKQKFGASILFVAYDPLARLEAISRREEMLRARLVSDEFNLQEFPLRTVSWLIDEALGTPLTQLKSEILQAMSIRLLDAMTAYADQLEGPETN